MRKRRKRTSKESIFVLGLIGAAFIIILINRFVTWLASLSITVWLAIAIAVIGLMFFKRYLNKKIKLKEKEQRRIALERQGNLNYLKRMAPLAFESYVCDLFKQFGYEAYVTKSTGDGGKDIMIYQNNFFAIAECKRYTKSKVTRPDIQKFHSAMVDCNAERGYFVTTGEFTNQAITYVLDKSITLINGKKLICLIEESSKTNQSNKSLDFILKTISP
ncbi:restriction endonuclease [Lentibacillus sp. N15]|uniref:restriction endonuclease n=1 Tax=Lentibacillus songyuanensis TaxID=3136161 RepID=UPI0031BBCCE3